MEPEAIPFERPNGPRPPLRLPTPDSATWDIHEDAEIELLGSPDSLDEVDVLDANWAPGQPEPGVPAEEILHVHRWTEGEDSADDLDLDDTDRERLAPATDELIEDGEGADDAEERGD
jgi:hypothetical protein